MIDYCEKCAKNNVDLLNKKMDKEEEKNVESILNEGRKSYYIKYISGRTNRF
jgi:hypothetical protein